MKREAWLWWGLGGASILWLVTRGDRSGTSGNATLGSPVESETTPKVTPHGHFGAARNGPPIHTHQGVDLAAPHGSRVLAIGNGTIVKTDPGIGKIVRKLVLDVPQSWTAGGRKVGAVVYADLGQPLVEPGARVRRGDPIAFVDKQGFVHVAVKEVVGHRETFFDPKEAGFIYGRSGLEVS